MVLPALAEPQVTLLQHLLLDLVCFKLNREKVYSFDLLRKNIHTNHSLGDYITIENAQNGVGASTTLGNDRLCGILFSAAAVTTTVTATVCSYVAPFKVGVHFDSGEAIGAGTPVVTAANNWGAIENAYSPPTTLGEGIGHAGFYLAYWQTVC